MQRPAHANNAGNCNAARCASGKPNGWKPVTVASMSGSTTVSTNKRRRPRAGGGVAMRTPAATAPANAAMPTGGAMLRPETSISSKPVSSIHSPPHTAPHNNASQVTAPIRISRRPAARR